MLCLKPKFLFEEDDGSKFGSIVLNVEAILLTLDDCMTATDTNIVDSDLALVAPAKLELRLLGSDCEQVDVSGGVLVEGHRLQQNIVVVVIHLLREIDDLVDVSLYLEGVRVHLLANLAFETLPVERSHVLVLSIWRFLLLLGQHPVLQALEVNQTYSSFALASNDQWVVGVLLGRPANSALDLIF